MDKNAILELIARMNKPWSEEKFENSTQTTSWKACREADALCDKSLYPLLIEIIEENKAKNGIAYRASACYIYGKLLENAFDHAACVYFISRMGKETNTDVLLTMLWRIVEIPKNVRVPIPDDIDITPILTLARAKISYVRRAAILVLGACPRKESLEILKYYLMQEDVKTYKEEICNANIALQIIGGAEEIPLLERFVKSRFPNVKYTAQLAIQLIKERNNL